MTNLESFYKILNESGSNVLNLTFEQLKSTLGELPEKSKYRSWWANDSSHEYSKVWCSAGYNVKKVIPDFYVCFTKIKTEKINSNNIQKINQTPIIIDDINPKEKNIDEENNKNEKFEELGDNINTVESIRALHNSPTSTTKKETDYTGYHVFGGVLMVIDLIIWIPLLITNFLRKDTFIPILLIGGIVYFISLLLVCVGRPRGHVVGNSSSFYEQAMYNEMKYHNMKMREMAMNEQMQRTQEELNRVNSEIRTSLADKVDTRITNIFRNPWEGIL